MGLALPPASKPVASYVMATRVGNLIYTGVLACSLLLKDTVSQFTPLPWIFCTTYLMCTVNHPLHRTLHRPYLRPSFKKPFFIFPFCNW